MKRSEMSAFIKNIRCALNVFIDDGEITQLLLPESDDGPRSGLFDDVKKMAVAAAEVRGTVPSVFFTPNPVKESFRVWVKNRLAKTSSAVKDGDIERRKWLLLDFDPVRPKKTPSNDAEFDATMAVARECRDALRKAGWAEPVVASSGNGAHVLYRLDLPNNQKSLNLIRGCLTALSLQFSTATVTLDMGTANASHLTRMYGTVNRKGTESSDRSYEASRLFEVPDVIETVTEEQLFAIARRLPIAPTEKSGQRFDVDGWIREYGLQIAFDTTWNSGHKWILSECPWDGSHRRTSFIIRFADEGVAAGCLHESCAGKDWPQLRSMFEGKSDGTPETTSNSPEGVRAQNQPQTSQLIQLASIEVKPFRTPQGEAYATIPFNNRNEHYRVGSTAFREYLTRNYFLATKNAPQPTALSQAVSQVSADARFGDSVESVFIRVGRSGNRNYLDLADDTWAAIEFGADGWDVVRKPSIKFRRERGMLPLPKPIRGGDLNDLREFLNLRTDDDWILLVTDLVNAISPEGPYPILGISGEAGSGKTTMARVHRKLVDPNQSPARSMPRDERELMVMADNSWALCFDNLSFLPIWFSDCLCRLSTGGGMGRRSLYTDSEEFLFNGERPILLNGIEELATRTDLLSRSVLFELPVIPKYVAEKDFWFRFDAAHPQLLGALLDVAVGALQRLSEVKLPEPPRMADFARLGIAVESAMKLPVGTFIRSYSLNRRNATALALEACPFSVQIAELAKKEWKVSATKLVEQLDSMVGDETRSRRNWPKNPKVLSGMLKRLNTALRNTGVEVEIGRDNTRNRNRTISIRQSEERGAAT